MARTAVRLAKLLQCPLWILGIEELRENGIFRPFVTTVKEEMGTDLGRLRVYKHFSYGQFLHDLKDGQSYDLARLDSVGQELRDKFFL